jgi:NAD(P)-dependent dehydrogenase (short-subunit alcohol dehydrogenase family)
MQRIRGSAKKVRKRVERWILNPAANLFPPTVEVQEADRMAQKHNGKIALITGANKGIGFEVARQLGTEGITVLVGARDPQLGEGAATKLRTEGVDAHFIELDVTKPESIAKAAEQIRGRYDRVDILVNNAGVLAKGDGPPSVADPDAVRRVLDVNFFGVLAVTQAMLPLVRKAASGRIVMVSSGLGSLTWNADPNWSFAAIKPLGYNGSKAILNMMTVQLAWELRNTPIKVNTVNPGYTATDLNGNSGTQTIEEGAAEIVRQSLVPDDAPTGGFFETGGVVPW